MGRLLLLARVAVLLLLVESFSGCGSSNPVSTVTTYPTPTKVTLTPTPTASLEIGKTATFSAAASNGSNTTLTTPISFQSSNPAVLTVTSTGLACAGSWDSLTAPTVCTPGAVGVATVTAVAQGISSPPTTIYVHQHIDSVVVIPQAGQPGQTNPCFSKGETFNYQATAYSRQGGPAPGLDITDSVGPFTWQAINANVASITAATTSNPVNGLLPGQARITANIPGTTPIIATVSGVSSTPFAFDTCLVQSITLAPSSGGDNTVFPARGSNTSITATVTDTRGNNISGTFLTWCSSDFASVNAGSANCGTGPSTNFTATATSSGGGAAIIASCTPPNCNVNVFPSNPVYPPQPITVLAGPPLSTTTGAATATTWVTTTGCKGTDGCVSELVPLTTTVTNNAPATTVGTAISLPATPNSMVFNRQGTAAYLGTDTAELGTRGIMVLSVANKAVSQYPPVAGRVLAVSPDGGSAIVSDTVDTPNQVYLFNCSSGAATSAASSGSCTTNSNVALNITGATAAAFSSDGLKAYIAAGSTLYVYSKLDALKTISLSAPVNDVTFLANGAFAYLAGGDPAGVMVRGACDDSLVQGVATTGVPLDLMALPDGVHVLGVESPGIELLTASNIYTTCPPTVNNAATFVNLGQGNFIPTEATLSSDGSTAYLLTQSSGSVLIFNVGARTTSAIQLTGNVLPLQASATPDGSALYVGASDGTVHFLSTSAGGTDLQQIEFQQNASQLQAGLCGNVNFPTQSVVSITGAMQSGATTIYSYTLSSGPALQVGRKITITGMANNGNNGVFTIAGLGNGTFTVGNAIGVTASGQAGSGTVAFACNPDLVAVQP